MVTQLAYLVVIGATRRYRALAVGEVCQEPFDRTMPPRPHNRQLRPHIRIVWERTIGGACVECCIEPIDEVLKRTRLAPLWAGCQVLCHLEHLVTIAALATCRHLVEAICGKELGGLEATLLLQASVELGHVVIPVGRLGLRREASGPRVSR